VKYTYMLFKVFFATEDHVTVLASVHSIKMFMIIRDTRKVDAA